MGVNFFPSQLPSVWSTHVASSYSSGPPSKGTVSMFYKIIQMFLRVWTLTLAQQQRVQERMRGVPVVLQVEQFSKWKPWADGCSACWRTPSAGDQSRQALFSVEHKLDYSFWNHIRLIYSLFFPAHTFTLTDPNCALDRKKISHLGYLHHAVWIQLMLPQTLWVLNLRADVVTRK